MTSLQNIARALGGAVVAGTVVAPGPGHSKHDRSMQVFLDPNAPDGFRVTSYAGDDWRICRDDVRARLGISDKAPLAVSPQREPARERGPGDVRAIELWSAAAPVRGTPAEAYLASRGLSAPPDDNVLRFHLRCPFKLEDATVAYLPAMVALFRDILTDEPCGIHRTALKPDGSGKADLPGLGNPKKMLGRVRGAAIKLSDDEEVTTGLGTAEGIETALTAYCANWRPVWALGSAGAISTFPVLGGVKTLTIFADADPAGIKAAQACQARWCEAGRECRVIRPRLDGADWNDVRARA